MDITVGGRRCVYGFDWSYWQPPRGLRLAKLQGHEFAVIKATEGDAYRDPRYRQHIDSVVDAGLVPGAYHFARPDWSDGGPYGDGRQEAELFLSVLDDRVDFAVLDLEATVLDAARTTDYVLGWWDRIMESGRFPIREQRLTYVGFYFNWRHAVAVRDRSCLWVPGYTAGYQNNPDPAQIALPRWAADLWPEGWCIWQYTSSGTVAGLHPSDVNVGLVSWLDAVRTGQPGMHGEVEDHLPDDEEDHMQLWQIEGDPAVFAVGLAGALGPPAGQEPQAFKGGAFYYVFPTEQEFLLVCGRERPIGVLRHGQDDPLITTLNNMARVYQA